MERKHKIEAPNRIKIKTSRNARKEERITIIIKGYDNDSKERIELEFQKALRKSKRLLNRKIKYELISI